MSVDEGTGYSPPAQHLDEGQGAPRTLPPLPQDPLRTLPPVQRRLTERALHPEGKQPPIKRRLR